MNRLRRLMIIIDNIFMGSLKYVIKNYPLYKWKAAGPFSYPNHCNLHWLSLIASIYDLTQTVRFTVRIKIEGTDSLAGFNNFPFIFTFFFNSKMYGLWAFKCEFRYHYKKSKIALQMHAWCAFVGGFEKQFFKSMRVSLMLSIQITLLFKCYAILTAHNFCSC